MTDLLTYLLAHLLQAAFLSSLLARDRDAAT
jgi:hypothetical protein